MDNVSRLKGKLDELWAEGAALRASMDEFAEWDSIAEVVAHGRELFAFVARSVLLAEEAAVALKDELADLSGSDKQAALAKWLDEKVRLPWFLEFADGPALRLIISYAVRELNERFGHDWKGAGVTSENVGVEVVARKSTPPDPARVASKVERAECVERVEPTPADVEWAKRNCAAEAVPERPFRAPEYHAPIPEGRSDRERG